MSPDIAVSRETTPVPIEPLWVPVRGHEGLYEVSVYGAVRRTTGGRGARAGHVLRPAITRAGYRQVALRRDGKTSSKLVCQLVCEGFHGPRPPGMEVRHLDGNSLNDTAGNLAWGTHFENMQDLRAHGNHANSKKTHCVNGHEFTPENTLPRDGGNRRCRVCMLAQSQASKARRRSSR